MTLNKKILFVVTLSEQGGAQKYIADLSFELSKNGFETHLAARSEGWLFKTFTGQKKHLKFLIRSINPFFDIAAIFELYFLLKKIQPDIVHLNSSKAGVLGSLAARIAGIQKIIYTAHGYVFNEPMPRWKKKFYEAAERISSKWKDHIIAVSKNDKNSALKHHISNEQKITVIHNALKLSSLNFLSNEAAKKKLFEKMSQTTPLLPKSPYPIIGTVANFYETKGLRYFIDAAKKIKKIYQDSLFIIIGKGQDKEKYNEYIQKENADNVIIIDSIDNASEYLKAFDVYVCSSLKEGFPYSLLEAMAAEIPIVTTNVGGIPEIVDGNCGILIDAHSSQAIAENIDVLVSHPEISKKISQAAKRKIDNDFSFDHFYNETLKVYLS